MAFEVTVLKDEDHVRILQTEGKITFAVTVDGYETHQQISVGADDTRDTIEKRMAEIAAQIAEEVTRNKPPAVPADIMALVNEP